MIFSGSRGVNLALGFLVFGFPLVCITACTDGAKPTTELPVTTVAREPVHRQPEADAPSVYSAVPPVVPPVLAESPERFFFDVNGHTQAEVQALLERTNEIYEAALAESKQAPGVTMVLHGPDVKYFASSNYAGNRALVDLAAKLDAFGFIDLKVCAVSSRSMGIAESDYPRFIEVVPYGPGAVDKLREQGVPQL